MQITKISLSRREVGIVGLIVFLIYGQCDDIDFDSIIGRTTSERNNSILALKAEISKNSYPKSSEVTCALNNSDCEILERIISQINDGSAIREAGFDVSVVEIKQLKNKFDVTTQ